MMAEQNTHLAISLMTINNNEPLQ